MLEVSLNLTLVGAMLFGIVVASFNIEVDSLNSPTTEPILDGRRHVGATDLGFKSE